MCEKNGGLQPNGQCSEDEYCAGPNTLENSVCGKKLLCTQKGTSQNNFSAGILCNRKGVISVNVRFCGFKINSIFFYRLLQKYEG